MPEQLAGWCPRLGSRWGTLAWRLSRRHQSRLKPCCKWPRLFLPAGGRDFCGGAPEAAHWWSGTASRSWRASKRRQRGHQDSSWAQARFSIKNVNMKVGWKLRLGLPYDTACDCCSMTPNMKGSAWRCGCQAVGKTVQKPRRGTIKQVRGTMMDRTFFGNNFGSEKSYSAGAKHHQMFQQVIFHHSQKPPPPPPHTCMAAVNWPSFSMVSSDAPLCTFIKTEFLKKYLQFWWSIWYSSSNISALTSGEDLCRREDGKVSMIRPSW